MSRHADAHLSRRPASSGLSSAAQDQSSAGTTTTAVNGALAGAVATVAMTVAMTVLNGAPPWARRKSLPPRQVTMRIAAEADTHPERWPETVRKGATAVSHLAYGAGAGAGYGVMAHRLGGDTITRGTAFGLALWCLSYAGWLPATGVRRPPTAQPPRVETLMIAVHVVYGVTLGLVYHRLSTR